VLEDVKIVPIVFEKKLYLDLAEAARARGMSVSALIRIIVSDYLSRIKQTGEKPNQPAEEDPPGIDPVVKMDMEELDEEVSKLEAMLVSIDDAISKAQSKYADVFNAWLDSNKQRILAKLTDAENTLKKLRSKYYALKREARDYNGVEELAARMYGIKMRIKEIRGKLSGKA
jgi:chromosome segregation ATPase